MRDSASDITSPFGIGTRGEADYGLSPFGDLFMTGDTYRFTFDETVPLEDAELSLQLAVIAAAGLYGESRVRMELAYDAQESARTIVIARNGEIDSAAVRIFTAFLTREFGDDAFSVRCEASRRSTPQEVACAS